MRNTLPTSAADLITKLGTAKPGVVKYGVALKLTTGLADLLTQASDELTLADNRYETSKEAVGTARGVVKSILSTARAHATLVRDLAKPTLGTRYSQAWDGLGFSGSIEVSRSLSRVLGMLPNMASYLASHETLENDDLDATAVRTTSLHSSLLAAKNGLNEKDAARKTLLQTRKEKEAQARLALRVLAKDLALALSPTDPRWTEFGFNPPGILATPTVPLNVIVALIGPRAVALKWDKAQRAGYYRVWKKVNGVDSEFVAVGNPADLDFTIDGLPVNSTIQIAISAVNNGGESAVSEVITVTTP